MLSNKKTYDLSGQGGAPKMDYRRKSIIEQAGDQVAPGWVFKHITKFFADRKFITIAFIHLTMTMVIFSKLPERTHETHSE